MSDKTLEGFDDRLARMYLRTLARCIEAENAVTTLTADNATLQATIDMHVADLASLRAKNEALEARTRMPDGWLETLGGDPDG